MTPEGVGVPQVDVSAGYLERRPEIDAAVARVLARGWYVLGEEVDGFEREFAGWLGTSHVVSVASGTDAVALALRALGVGPGDLVLTVSHTAVATVAAVELTGAMPVLVDVEPGTFTIDPASLDAAVRWLHTRPELGRPAAIVVVHLYGQVADMAALLAVAADHGLPVVEDCAQAHGAGLDGRRVGRFGALAAFSFYPTKNLGAVGDAGAVATDDKALADRVRLLRQYGWRERFVSEMAGTNSRMDEIQAAVLRARLPYLDGDNERRRQVAARYGERLATAGLQLPVERQGALHAYHQYVVTTGARDALRRELQERGVATAVHYPVPVHRQPAYAGRLPPAVPLAVTDDLASKILSLPIFPQLSEAQVERVVEAVLSASGGRRL